MAWTIELDQAAVRDLDKLDQQPRWRILAFLHDRVATLDRVIASIEDRALCVLVVKIGNRREVYR